MSGSARDDSPDPPSSSGGVPTPSALVNPTLARAATDSSYSYTSASYLGNMWTGLIRRFSTESDFQSQLDAPSYSQNQSHGHGHGPANKDGVNGVFNPVRRTASPFRPPPLEPIVLHGYSDSTPDTARLLSCGIAEEIRTMVPERLRIAEDWHLIYSLEQDGASLTTMYQKCNQYERARVGFVLVVKDQEGGTFGAYLSEHPHPAHSYFGNGECFLWRASLLASLPPPPSADTTNLTRNTTLAPPSADAASDTHPAPSASPTPSETIRFKAFPYSGLNDYCMHCETGFVSVGSGGGHYGLWLDDSLSLGHSSTCETFGNEPLSDEGEKFGILGVELWVIGR